MQTWAKRGVRAALVTGGMLAAGTGVASASEDCPDRPVSPLGESVDALGDGTPRHSGPCFAGELFPEEVGSVPGGSTGRQPATALTGTIDPVRDLLPAVENDVTRVIPRITDGPDEQSGTGKHRYPPKSVARHAAESARPVSPPEPTGGAADTVEFPVPLSGAEQGVPGSGNVPGHSSVALGLAPLDAPRGRHAAEPASGTPAEGFRRSVSWSGAIGKVVKNVGDTARDLVAAPASREAAGALVIPSGDPAVLEGFDDHTASIVELWKGALGRTTPAPARELPGALLSPSTDLTSAGMPASRLLTVPRSLLGSALSSAPVARQDAQQDFVPLYVPGEQQEQAAELPNLSDPAMFELSRSTGATARDTGVETTLPVLGELNAFDGGRAEAADLSRITRVLEGERLPAQRAAEPALPAFSDTPELSDVAVTVLDELAATVPERRQVSQNPFRWSTARTAPAGGMALPVLDGGGLPEITAVQGETLPINTRGTDETSAVDEVLGTAATLRNLPVRI